VGYSFAPQFNFMIGSGREIRGIPQ
jgi:hypothetical protein